MVILADSLKAPKHKVTLDSLWICFQSHLKTSDMSQRSASLESQHNAVVASQEKTDAENRLTTIESTADDTICLLRLSCSFQHVGMWNIHYDALEKPRILLFLAQQAPQQHTSPSKA
mmetsp:Transcript_16757/g.38543  ORF Transcript_16757/g.38543 Transcript_16757/m.38543 type:complete len:117 (-) Transcript_16757:277-627(-)